MSLMTLTNKSVVLTSIKPKANNNWGMIKIKIGEKQRLYHQL